MKHILLGIIWFYKKAISPYTRQGLPVYADMFRLRGGGD